MTTDRQMQAFELISIHGCTQAQAGEMLDPPISQSTVNRDIKDLFIIHPELEAVKDYLVDNVDFSIRNEPNGILRYDEGMDGCIKTKF